MTELTRDLVKPKRQWRYELYSLAAVLAVPLAVLFVFPYEAVGFTAAADEPPRTASCAFVTLTEDEESAALSAARAAWKVSAEGVRRMRADLSVDAMPEEVPRAVMDVSERTRAARASSVAYDELPMPSTRAAGAPVRIAAPAAGREDGLPFSRKELLNID